MTNMTIEITTIDAAQRSAALNGLLSEVRAALMAVFVAETPRIEAAGLSLVAHDLRQEFERLADVEDEHA